MYERNIERKPLPSEIEEPPRYLQKKSELSGGMGEPGFYSWNSEPIITTEKIDASKISAGEIHTDWARILHIKKRK